MIQMELYCRLVASTRKLGSDVVMVAEGYAAEQPKYEARGQFHEGRTF